MLLKYSIKRLPLCITNSLALPQMRSTGSPHFSINVCSLFLSSQLDFLMTETQKSNSGALYSITSKGSPMLQPLSQCVRALKNCSFIIFDVITDLNLHVFLVLGLNLGFHICWTSNPPLSNMTSVRTALLCLSCLCFILTLVKGLIMSPYYLFSGLSSVSRNLQVFYILRIISYYILMLYCHLGFAFQFTRIIFL